ncbi:MAG: transglycosylase domain-containing protein [Rubrobacteraceae bacterium]
MSQIGVNLHSAFQTGTKVKEKRKSRPPGKLLKALRTLFNLAIILTLTVAMFVVGLYFFVIETRGGELEAGYPSLVENSYVYDAEGEEIGRFIARENRRTLSPDDVGRYLPQAVVAIEDRRFENHVGVDFEGLGRAAWTDIRARRVQEGGSTITEQLMKNLFVPEDERYEVSFWRRFVQACLAFSYEANHTKEEILTTYLSTVYFGNGAYGAEVAANRHFGKSADELTLPEAATLAGFLHAPSTYMIADDGPSRERATDRRDEVLRLMEEQGMISTRERLRAQGAPLDFEPETPPDYSEYEPFLEKVSREVEDALGEDALETGGLRIRTTIDPEMQREAIASIEDTLFLPDDPSAAVVSVEPQSGAILALAGQAGGFNLALDSRRQPGSSFKPVVLAAALKENISPESVYVSESLALGEKYVINNYGYIERGPISLYDAMAQSDNTVFVKLGMDVGMENVVETAKEMGVESPLEPIPATAIGGAETNVSPLEMASAYSTFAGGGIHREAYAVASITRVGFGESETVFDHQLSAERVMSGNQAAAATDAMRGVVEHGTASNFHDLDEEIGRPSVGKTGTTDDYVDAWYVGYTPRLSTAVWVGYPEGNRSMVGVHGLDEAGGETLPLDLWALYMDQATEDDPVLDFPQPNLYRLTNYDATPQVLSEEASIKTLGTAN